MTGDVFLCCLDYNGEYTFGNIKNDPILNIFYSKEFEKIRALHYNRKLGDLEMV